MSAAPLATTTAADMLLHEAAADDWALISPSVYECGRIVSDAPWLDGHPARLRFLLAEQAPDGGWGLAGFRLVTSLSATEALLTACGRGLPQDRAVPTEDVARAAAAGARALRGWLDEPEVALPDLVAIEVLVPRLIDLVNDHLHRFEAAHHPVLAPVAAGGPLATPPGTAPEILRRLRGATAAGHPVPPKLWHSWEIIGSDRSADPAVTPVSGSVGCSPAATAAWLRNRPEADHPSLRYLDAVQARADGLFPVGAPMPHFERSWIINLFQVHRVPCRVPEPVLDALELALGEDGAAAGDGLPVDADDTASVLWALDAHGRSPDLDSLLRYYDGTRFYTYPDERTPSPTANGHALEALGHRLDRRPDEADRYATPARVTRDWLVDAQAADGSWADKWHGSPYYATATCANALASYGGPEARPAVERAVDWILGTRQGDRWGHGSGTAEETAYAAWILSLSTRDDRRAEIRAGMAAARATLAAAEITPRTPALWIGKDIYTPVRIVRATCLAVLHRLDGSAHGD
ncbi:prenyltransferase/squalene oxidase repeat-containing protein [Micromonospora humi]|uniref:Prenyltransferase and squalene oxidase repeat-containing protein n=1 Tax=Micromonospora humi TaxID=745366 RepID=A0A1C5K9W0_9ACTN|nr:prenyltransferase/squalene oxidase repeat-containing protein [Micromonospora humi]SCG79534.1 Prenyltransferase and squalene oxidase repeat-containing protein [Micromonospora humi]